jgi:hypothetical protein
MICSLIIWRQFLHCLVHLSLTLPVSSLGTSLPSGAVAQSWCLCLSKSWTLVMHLEPIVQRDPAVTGQLMAF